MSVEESVKAYLETVTPGKVSVLGLPREAQYPHSVYHVVSQPPGQVYQDGSGKGLGTDRIQVNVWAREYGQDKTLAAQMILETHGFNGDFYGTEVAVIQVEGGNDNFDGTAKLYHYTFDLMITH